MKEAIRERLVVLGVLVVALAILLPVSLLAENVGGIGGVAIGLLGVWLAFEVVIRLIGKAS